LNDQKQLIDIAIKKDAKKNPAISDRVFSVEVQKSTKYM